MERINKIILSVLMIGLFASSVMAQQEAQYTNFMFNKLPLNPAYAGSKEVACISALHRSQWGLTPQPVGRR